MPIREDLEAFLAEWHDPSPFLEVRTSGSTGTPKRIRVRKERMLNSARLTCDYLGLGRGDKALLCMPLRYIAGKMMVVRSLCAGLDLVAREPSGHPLAGWEGRPPRFAAMIPLQVYDTLRVPEERRLLERIGILIIGGGAIDEALERELRPMPNAIYSTYGMTETLSHVALRRLNGPEASPYYRPLPSVTLSLSAENTLVIDAPLVCDGPLVTNDIARLLPDGSFAIIGRKDNVINSGGVKIQIEEVEERLRPHLAGDFAVTSVPDGKFGEAVTLLLSPVSPPRSLPDEAGDLARERQDASLGRDRGPLPNEARGDIRMSCPMTYACLARRHPHVLPHDIRMSCPMTYACHPEVSRAISYLPKYQRPKHILRIREIPRTGSGKIDRPACRELAGKLTVKSSTINHQS